MFLTTSTDEMGQNQVKKMQDFAGKTDSLIASGYQKKRREVLIVGYIRANSLNDKISVGHKI